MPSKHQIAVISTAHTEGSAEESHGKLARCSEPPSVISYGGVLTIHLLLDPEPHEWSRSPGRHASVRQCLGSKHRFRSIPYTRLGDQARDQPATGELRRAAQGLAD